MNKDYKKEVEDLADLFFQINSYTGDSDLGKNRQANLNKTIPIITICSRDTVIDAYNISINRVKTAIEEKLINPLVYLLSQKKINISDVTDDLVIYIHSYMERIYDIRNFLAKADTKNDLSINKKYEVSCLLGEFNDFKFIEDCFKIGMEKRQIDAKFTADFIKYLIKKYINYSKNINLTHNKRK
ncbi:MAG: hypothetical protein RR404_02475 [Bacilli bacterium]